MAPNRQIRRSGKISSPARNLMGHQRHTQIVPECVCRLLSTPADDHMSQHSSHVTVVWDVTDVILSSNQLEMPKLDVRLIFIMYQSFLAHKISAGLRAQMPSGRWVQLLVVTHTYWFICSSACSLQNCLNKHMYTPEKCDGTLRSLYECCQKMYDADSTSGQENSGSTACPMPKVVTKWLKDHPR